MNIAKRIQQVASASKAIADAQLAQKTLRQEIGKEFRRMRTEKHIKGITLAAAIKESPVFVYMLEQGQIPLSKERITKIHNALERLGGR
jgi:ribosome-binding protein aMBF1 (putative translation factor)